MHGLQRVRGQDAFRATVWAENLLYGRIGPASQLSLLFLEMLTRTRDIDRLCTVFSKWSSMRRTFPGWGAGRKLIEEPMMWGSCPDDSLVSAMTDYREYGRVSDLGYRQALPWVLPFHLLAMDCGLATASSLAERVLSRLFNPDDHWRDLRRLFTAMNELMAGSFSKIVKSPGTSTPFTQELLVRYSKFDSIAQGVRAFGPERGVLFAQMWGARYGVAEIEGMPKGLELVREYVPGYMRGLRNVVAEIPGSAGHCEPQRSGAVLS